MTAHERPNLLNSAPSGLPPVSQLRNEGRVIDSLSAEPAFAEIVRSAERLNVGDQVVHSGDMRRIYPSGQVKNDGYIRKLSGHGGVWDSARVAETKIDLELIRRVLANATKKGGDFSQRNLDKAAGLTRGTVGEIIRGKNKNPTSSVLVALATAMEVDLSVFGLDHRPVVLPNGQKLVEAMATLLDTVGLGHLSDEYAGRLARQLPGILEDISAPVELEETDEKPLPAEPSPRPSRLDPDILQ